jgi:hypothetical protein
MSMAFQALTCSFLAVVFIGHSPAAEKPSVILQRAIQAHGGEANLSRLKAGHSKADGVIALGAGVPFTQEAFYQLPNRLKEIQVLEVDGQKRVVTLALEGERGWINTNGQTVAIGDTVLSELREAVHLIQVSRFLSLQDPGVRLTSLAEIQVGGAPAYGLRVSVAGHRDIDLYFEKETGLLVKVERRMRDLGTMKEFAEARVYADFQDVNGIRIPRKTVVYRDGKEFMRATVAEAGFSERADPRLFQKP